MRWRGSSICVQIDDRDETILHVALEDIVAEYTRQEIVNITLFFCFAVVKNMFFSLINFCYSELSDQ